MKENKRNCWRGKKEKNKEIKIGISKKNRCLDDERNAVFIMSV